MRADFHEDPVYREELILQYLEHRLPPESAEAWASHYLGCSDCFEEIRATELLIRALGTPVLERQRIDDVTVLRFNQGTQLLAYSLELNELSKAVRTRTEGKVLIDMSSVSRIDSTGLGVLMSCYCHAINNEGALKLLNPEPTVRKVMKIAKIDRLLETFEDEESAISSFRALRS